MASLPPVDMGPDTNTIALYLAPCWVLGVLCLALCTARCYTRVRSGKFLADDYLIVAAEIGSLASLISATIAGSYGWGRKSIYVDPSHATAAFKSTFALQTIWVVTLALVRISLACSLLRFGSSWMWRGVLFAMIVIQALISTGWLAVQFGQCVPLRSFWEPVESLTCWDRNVIIDYGWFSAAYFVLMDLVLALMPIKLARSLHRPMRERILICCLMGLGLCATVIAGVKMTTFDDVGLGDPLYDTIKPSLYAKLEEQVGIIAACTPCLKAPIENLLKRAGILAERDEDTRPSFVISIKEGPSDNSLTRDNTGGDKSMIPDTGAGAGSVGMGKRASVATTERPGGGRENWEAV